MFKTHKSYEPLKPVYQGKARNNIAGFFQAGQAINYVTLTLEGGLDNLGIIYHEYVHLLVNNNVSGMPVWFNEGLAEYYRTFQVNESGDRAFIGRIPGKPRLLLREQFLPLAGARCGRSSHRRSTTRAARRPSSTPSRGRSFTI